MYDRDDVKRYLKSDVADLDGFKKVLELSEINLESKEVIEQDIYTGYSICKYSAITEPYIDEDNEEYNEDAYEKDIVIIYYRNNIMAACTWHDFEDEYYHKMMSFYYGGIAIIRLLKETL